MEINDFYSTTAGVIGMLSLAFGCFTGNVFWIVVALVMFALTLVLAWLYGMHDCLCDNCGKLTNAKHPVYKDSRKCVFLCNDCYWVMNEHKKD